MKKIKKLSEFSDQELMEYAVWKLVCQSKEVVRGLLFMLEKCALGKPNKSDIIAEMKMKPATTLEDIQQALSSLVHVGRFFEQFCNRYDLYSRYGSGSVFAGDENEVKW